MKMIFIIISFMKIIVNSIFFEFCQVDAGARRCQEKWLAIASLNGGEASHKFNREVVVLTDMPAVYDRLANMFAWDWAWRE